MLDISKMDKDTETVDTSTEIFERQEGSGKMGWKTVHTDLLLQMES